MYNNQVVKMWPQYLAASSAAFGTFGTGTVLGWSSVAGPKLKQNEYGFEVSDEDNAWIGSLAMFGAALTSFPVGYMIEKIGRKTTMLILACILFVGWLMITFATCIQLIFIGRFLTGMSGGTFAVTVPVYVSEISQDHVRGTLGTFMQIMLMLGILYTYVIGSYVSVYQLNIFSAIIPIIFILAFKFMPETPYFLMYRGEELQAKKVLKWLRGSDHEVEIEFDKIKHKVFLEKEQTKSSKFSINKYNVKILFICLTLVFLLQFSGINAVIFNTIDIFKNSGTEISPELSTIIIGILQVISTLFSTVVIDRLGRKPLLLISAVFMGLSSITLGTYFHLRNADNEISNPSLIPLISLCIFVMSFSLGLGPIPFIFPSEICDSKIKAFVMSAVSTLNWILAFVVTKTFIIIQASLGDGGAFWVYGGILFIGAIFIFIIVPETKGKSIEEIKNIIGNKDQPNSFYDLR